VNKILLADDERIVRTLVTITLGQDSRYTLLEAVDGYEALALARSERPRLLLLDINMPGLDGYEVCRALKTDPETHPISVVMLTARTQDEDRSRARAVGADGYLCKPFSPLALLEKVEEILGE
jgi:CheY-like chemotaxis protein